MLLKPVNTKSTIFLIVMPCLAFRRRWCRHFHNAHVCAVGGGKVFLQNAFVYQTTSTYIPEAVILMTQEAYQ